MGVFFSVIIPTYNRSGFLTRSLASVFVQKYKDFECLVIDDGSTDDTREQCSLYPVKYIFIKNSGVSFARNTGALNAEGEWLAFLDSDDQWLPNKLQIQYEYIKNNPSCNIVHGNEIWYKNGNLKNQKKIHRRSGGHIFIPSLRRCLISPSTVVIQKNLFKQYGGFREDFPVCEDYDLWLRITANESIGFVEDNIINKFGGHEDQLSQRFRAMDYWRVRSIDALLSESSLKEEYRAEAEKELIRKSQILLKGFQKHHHQKKFDEIYQIVQKYGDKTR